MKKNKAISWFGRGAALAQMSASLGSEIVDVVERMHGSISRVPLPIGKLDDDRARGISGLVYKVVKSGFEASHEALQTLSGQLEGVDEDDQRWLTVRAAINGVCGDALLERNNPIAQKMIFTRETAAPRDNSDTLLLFIHGLCMSETGWNDGVHIIASKQLAERFNARVAYLRYNSGKHISQNGEELAQLLESYCQDDKNIVIVGHSMGGLLARSASHYGQQQNATWINKFSHLVALGTPHNGAPLERLGNMANMVLKVSPYTKPLSQLVNIRSAGIRDLRFGNLLHEDWEANIDPEHYDDLRTPVKNLSHTQYLFLAGTRSELITDNPFDSKHDMLVTVESAWAQGENPDFILDGDNINRVLLSATDHLRLMFSCEVYDEIEGWLDELDAK